VGLNHHPESIALWGSINGSLRAQSIARFLGNQQAPGRSAFHKFCIIPGRPVNKGLGVLQKSGSTVVLHRSENEDDESEGGHEDGSRRGAAKKSTLPRVFEFVVCIQE